jgi:hypothetical protein
LAFASTLRVADSAMDAMRVEMVAGFELTLTGYTPLVGAR